MEPTEKKKRTIFEEMQEEAADMVENINEFFEDW